LIKALKAFALAFSRLSCSVSFSICSISLSSCYGFAGLRLHPQLVLHLALLVLHHALLVAWIPTPIEHRQKLSPARQR
jgi:nucleoside permease NupC